MRVFSVCLSFNCRCRSLALSTSRRIRCWLLNRRRPRVSSFTELIAFFHSQRLPREATAGRSFSALLFRSDVQPFSTNVGGDRQVRVLFVTRFLPILELLEPGFCINPLLPLPVEIPCRFLPAGVGWVGGCLVMVSYMSRNHQALAEAERRT